MSDGIWVTRVRPDVYYRYEALDNTSYGSLYTIAPFADGIGLQQKGFSSKFGDELLRIIDNAQRAMAP